jgi:PST family polysaccharide transporter
MSGDHTQHGLAHRAFSGMLWVASSTALVTLARLINLIVLARLLAPGDFGVIALAMVIISLWQFAVQMGLPGALIQKPDVTPSDFNTAFTFGLGSSVIHALLVLFTAPIFATLAQIPVLTPVLRILAISFVVHAIFDPTEAKLRRNLEFRLLARVDVFSYLTGYFLTSVSLALLGFGLWSLVAAFLCEKLIRCAQLLYSRGMAGRPGFSLQSARALFDFGIGATLASFSNVAATRGDKAVVARLGEAGLVGEYDRAYQLMVLPANIMDSVVARVLFPALSQIKDNPAALRINYCRGLALTSAVMIPTAVFCILLSGELIAVLLGQQWQATGELFRIFAFAMLFRCSYKLSDELAQACGAVYRRAWRQVCYAGAVLLGALLGTFWGIEGAAIGVSAAIICNFLLMADLTNRLTGCRWPDILRAHRAGTILGFLCAASTWAGASLAHANAWPDAAVVITAAMAAAIVTGGIVLLRPTILGTEGAWLLELVKRV